MCEHYAPQMDRLRVPCSGILILTRLPCEAKSVVLSLSAPTDKRFFKALEMDRVPMLSFRRAGEFGEDVVELDIVPVGVRL
jgi:hypothetical protein